MSGATIDWNWFFSSLAQSVAALVGIFAAFIITKIINNQGEFQRKNARLKELLSLSAKYRDALSDRSFDWYNERRLEYALERLEDVAEDEDFEFRGREENRPEGDFEIEFEVAAEDMQLFKSKVVVNVTR